jgi:DNA polymerase-3 subunit delta'
LKEICKDLPENNQIISPDVILSGDPGVPPGIDRCREIARELMVRPVDSPGRVAVIFSADKLSLPASNSLLKIAEEPPDGAVMIFLSSPEGELIPTLTSRSWSFSIFTTRKRDQLILPSEEKSWVKWLSGNDKRDVNDLLADLECWTDEALRNEDQILAGKLESLKIMGARRKLPKTMF